MGNRKGWRLPTIQELLSLIDPTAPAPKLPPGHPFINVGIFYWSATTAIDQPTVALDVNMGTGNVSLFPKAFGLDDRAWCVRGGQGVDPQ